ncbi:MAG: hypothetical protein ACJ72E_14100 [Marmoricola sp.]
MRTGATVLAVLLLAAGCAGNDSKRNTHGGPTLSCNDVWVVGRTLPATYAGCVDPDGSIQAAKPTVCSDGSRLFVYKDKLWAITPLPVQVKDSSFQRKALDVCTNR